MGLKPIPPEQWGSDHFSTLLYVETRVVDHDGLLNGEQMRAASAGYPTRLRNGVQPDHGDMDCLRDMEAAGLLTGGKRNTFSAFNAGEGPDPKRKPLTPVQLTPSGWALAHLLRRRRGTGLKGLPPVEQVCQALADPRVESTEMER